MAMMLIAAAALLLVSIGGASRLDAGSAAGAAGGAASGAAGAAGDAASGAAGAAGSAASGAAGAAGSAASGAAGAAGSAASGAAGAAGDAASGAAGAAGSAASGAVGAAGNAASGAAGAAGSAASGAVGAAGNAASGVLGGAARGSAGSASIGPGNAPTASIAAPTDEVGARAVASLPAGLLPIEAGGGTIGPWVAYVPELGQVHGTKEALSGLARPENNPWDPLVRHPGMPGPDCVLIATVRSDPGGGSRCRTHRSAPARADRSCNLGTDPLSPCRSHAGTASACNMPA